jgi:5'-methylthioadenosine phosphorylase
LNGDLTRVSRLKGASRVLGIIGGTNAGLALEAAQTREVASAWGRVPVEMGRIGGTEAAFVRRHGARHERLSSAVEHRANIAALAKVGAGAIVGTTVCGVVDPAMSLARAILFDDLYFPDNRLPDGSPCTFFAEPSDPARGHLIWDRPFSPWLRAALAEAAARAGVALESRGTYAYALGPRFNTRSEIAAFSAVGATGVSQTAGPEAVLAAELEIPYALLGFGVDYANGVSAWPTPVAELDANIAASKTAFAGVLGELASGFEPGGFDTGFVYRMEP